MTTPANAGVIVTPAARDGNIATMDEIGYPSEIGPYATNDLLQTNLDSVNSPATRFGSVAALTDGTYDNAPVDSFTWTSWIPLGDVTVSFVLDDHFDIGMIRVTVGQVQDWRSDQGWDVYTSTNGGADWDVLLLAVYLGHPGGYPATAGTGTTRTLTSDSGPLASNVNAIRFDTYYDFPGRYTTHEDNYQEIDIFKYLRPGTVITLR